MSAPINLNKARKARARAEKTARAAENVVIYGRTKAARDADDKARAAAEKHAEAHKRET